MADIETPAGRHPQGAGAGRVSVLLCTYNGGPWLEPLLDSVLAQTHAALLLQVRDDGSSDGTREHLAARARAEPRLRLAPDTDHIGVPEGYFRLLEAAEPTADWFAFCDQDDVWPRDKLARAVSALGEADDPRPRLYCARQQYVDDALRPLGRSRRPRRGPSFANALAENIAVGCTVVMNRAARDRVLACRPRRCVMHDWWCYLVVAAHGEVTYDPRVAVQYRLHGENQTGAPRNWLDDARRRLRRFRRQGADAFRIHDQATAFAACCADGLRAADRRTLQRFLASRASLGARLRYAAAPGIHRQATLDDLILRALIALGWY